MIPLSIIVVSKTDLAGLNIKDKLIEHHAFKEVEKEFDSNPLYSDGKHSLVTLEKEQVYADFLDSIDTDLFVFASKHYSKAGEQAFTVHSIGNFATADYGGKPMSLSPTHAGAIKAAMACFKSEVDSKKLDFKVSFEVTHHGPYLTKPSVFVELGSNETGWNNQLGGEVTAKAVMAACNAPPIKGTVCIGGPHYAPNFTKKFFEGGLNPTFIIPKHHVGSLTKDLLRQAVEKSIGGIEGIALDWKGLGTHKELVKSVLEGFDLPVKRI